MAGKQIYPVRFTGRRGTTYCDASFRTEHSEQWQRWLKYVRDNKTTTMVTCCCLPEETDVVRRRLKVHLSQSTDQCWLSSYSFTGYEHAPDCRFYSVWPDDQQAAIYTADVVKSSTDGTLVIRLPTGLQKKVAPESGSEKEVLKTIPGKRRKQSSMQLTGLLHLLWEQSGINVWHPAFDRKKRNSGWVSWRLNETATRIRIGRLPLKDSLLLMSMNNTRQADDNRQRVRAAEKSLRRLIIISQLASWSDAADERIEHTLPLGLFSGFPALELPEDVLSRLKYSYARELASWRRGARVIVICETEPPETTFTRIEGRNVPHSSCRVIDAALMVVSHRYIPLDSGYEGLIEERLWQDQRAFIKPLRYDGEADVFPDFILTDVCGNDALPMEVFGLSTPEYLKRRQEKVTYYDAEYGPGHWWYWDAYADPNGESVPPFPD
ncbi:MAG: DUF1173 family protein [Pantoea sp.]|uniref:DUF1173 family protein n=1 Tax=Pantoea sp. TaxID=69393 RepID=UPI00239AD64F|nr:DUF1173 family protein [Pantoea sp.]MDE1186171.1 DUF1173 family protein [Pantoea sp.]